MYKHSTYAKGRWWKRTIIEVLTTEFGSQPRSYWEGALKSGAVRVNNKLVTKDYTFKGGDLFTHNTHRHEPPVFGRVSLVAETADMLCVSKPSSMPIHPCGAYRDNSLVHILAREPLVPEQPPLHLVHRLDRVTSGVVVLAKSHDTAMRMSEQIRGKETTKIYLARVRGRFPNRERLSWFTEQSSVRAGEACNDHQDEDEEDEGQDEGQKQEKVKRAYERALLSVCDYDMDDSRAGSRHKRKAGQSSNEAIDEMREKSRKVEDHDNTVAARAVLSSEGPPKSMVNDDTVQSHVKMQDIPTWDELAKSEATRIGFIDMSTRVKGGQYTVSVWDDGRSASEGLVLRCPIGVVSFRDGVYNCHPEGREAVSIFRPVGQYDPVSDTSLVECRPVSGRTHQLRLHLQLIGSPIANDPCYGGELFYGQARRLEEARGALRLLRSKNMRPLSKVPHMLAVGADEAVDRDLLMTQKDAMDDSVDAHDTDILATLEETQRREGETEEAHIQRICRYCQAKDAVDAESMFHCDGIWLHAQMYANPRAGWGPFEGAPPQWASALLGGHEQTRSQEAGVKRVKTIVQERQDT